jgi:hypothetical protein
METSPELPPARIAFMLVRSSPPRARSGLWHELQDCSNTGIISSWKFGFSVDPEAKHKERIKEPRAVKNVIRKVFYRRN